MPRRLITTSILLLIAGAFITPIQRDLFVGDETKYGQVVREMRARHTFFLPTLNGTPFTHKPPIHFWMIDLLTFPLGVYSTWAFVLPSLLAFFFLLWLMWKIGGPLAAFICGSSLMIWTSAQSARMDVSFTAFIVLAVWQLERFFERDNFRALLWSAIAIGIAVLTKGPMAPVIALWRTHRFLINWILAVLVPYSLMSSKLDVYMMAMIPPVALLIAEYVALERGRPARWCNAISIVLMALIGIAGLIVTPQMIKS